MRMPLKIDKRILINDTNQIILFEKIVDFSLICARNVLCAITLSQCHFGIPKFWVIKSALNSVVKHVSTKNICLNHHGMVTPTRPVFARLYLIIYPLLFLGRPIWIASPLDILRTPVSDAWRDLLLPIQAEPHVESELHRVQAFACPCF